MMDGGALRNSAFEEPGLWPSTEQKLVLRAALGDRCDSGTAFAAWRRDLDESKPFDHEIARLLPLLYDNLRRWDCKDGLMDRLKGAYRMNWVKVQTLFAQLRPCLLYTSPTSARARSTGSESPRSRKAVAVGGTTAGMALMGTTCRQGRQV